METTYIEELSLNHWPALSTMLVDGWVLRFADGYTKRANSISSIYYSTTSIDQKIAECEKIYLANHLSPTYKMTPHVHPENLDDLLAERGYTVIDPSRVQTVRLDHVPEPTLTDVKIDESFSPE